MYTRELSPRAYDGQVDEEESLAAFARCDGLKRWSVPANPGHDDHVPGGSPPAVDRQPPGSGATPWAYAPRPRAALPRVGDRVLVSCVSAGGGCQFCREHQPTQLAPGRVRGYGGSGCMGPAIP